MDEPLTVAVRTPQEDDVIRNRVGTRFRIHYIEGDRFTLIMIHPVTGYWFNYSLSQILSGVYISRADGGSCVT